MLVKLRTKWWLYPNYDSSKLKNELMCPFQGILQSDQGLQEALEKSEIQNQERDSA